MAGFSFVGGSFDFSGRPSSHLNQGVLANMLAEIFASGGINDVEKAIVSAYGHLKPVDAAKSIKGTNYLSTNDVDVCHKIPIHSFQLALCATMNEQHKNGGAFSDDMWTELVDLYDTVMSTIIASPSSDIKALFDAIKKGDTHLACTIAWQICLAFDSSHDNLYFGYAVTNHSIGQSSDMHYDTGTALVCPPTPRGPGMEACLQTLEGTLGLPPTSAYLETDTSGDHWEVTSSVEGRRTQGTGFIETTRH